MHSPTIKPEKWTKKMWKIYTMGYYSTIKRNEIESFLEMWWTWRMSQSEVSQRQRNIKITEITKITNELVYKTESDSQT